MKLSNALRLAMASVLLLCGTAQAQLFRTYLSSAGNDANPCTLPQPCRLLPAALAAVASGGEIWMLDSANYNTSTVAISKSVTILAVPGEMGSVLGGASIGNRTAVSISAAGINVTLKNLVIRAASTPDVGDIGVLIGNAATVTIEDCTINGFIGPSGSNGLGIWASTGANATKVNVIRTTIRNGAWGIIVEGNANATISKSHIISNNRTGVYVTSVAGTFPRASVSDTVSNGNENGYYVAASGQTSQGASMYVTRSVASFNSNYGFGTANNAFALLVVGESMSTMNTNGAFVNDGAGTFLSRGNNLTGSPGNSGTISVYSGS
jgi:hypothetical protein